MASAVRSYAFRIDIEMPVERVWRAWVTPASLARWCAPSAVIRPQPDGSFRVRFDSAVEMDAHIDVFEPGQRLRLLLLASSSSPAFDGVEVDDFLFAGTASKTQLRHLNSGLPAGAGWDHYFARKRIHWQRALARLKVFVEKQLDSEETAP